MGLRLTGRAEAGDLLIMEWEALLSEEMCLEGLQVWQVSATRHSPEHRHATFPVIFESGGDADTLVREIYARAREELT